MYHQKIRSYAAAAAYLAGKLNRPLAHNTRIKASEDKIIITYHDNPIVTFTPDSVKLSSCGWMTYTTKERLNWYIPEGYYVYQERGVWYIRNRDNDTVLTFADGVTFWNDGSITGAGDSDESKKVKARTKQIKKYVDGYIKALLAGEVSAPGPGDCWYCCMRDDNGKSLGDLSNSDHISLHIEESYYVPSMLVNAMSDIGSSLFVRSCIDGIWYGADYVPSEWEKEIVTREVKSSLTRYIKRHTGIAA